MSKQRLIELGVFPEKQKTADLIYIQGNTVTHVHLRAKSFKECYGKRNNLIRNNPSLKQGLQVITPFQKQNRNLKYQ